MLIDDVVMRDGSPTTLLGAVVPNSPDRACTRGECDDKNLTSGCLCGLNMSTAHDTINLSKAGMCDGWDVTGVGDTPTAPDGKKMRARFDECQDHVCCNLGGKLCFLHGSTLLYV